MFDTTNEDSHSAHEFNHANEAHKAQDSGDIRLAVHLYLAAFEEASADGGEPDQSDIDNLRTALELAFDQKERSLAEHIYDRLEPYMTDEELGTYEVRLQNLALDKLSEYGISRTELENVADMISDEIGASVKLRSVTPIAHIEAEAEVIDDDEPEDDEETPQLEDVVPSIEDFMKNPQQAMERIAGAIMGAAQGDDQQAAKAPAKNARKNNVFDFSSLVGFDAAIEAAHGVGLCVDNDPAYTELIKELKAKHGVDGLSGAGSFIVRTSSRDDASHFMDAVVGELGYPAMRVSMVDAGAGVPVLQVNVSSDRHPRFSQGRFQFDTPSTLVLDDVDLWAPQLLEMCLASEVEDQQVAASIRQARESICMLKGAVENPGITVVASVGSDMPDSQALNELLYPMRIVDIYMPTDQERRDIWDQLADRHPSMRCLNRQKLTELSRNLSRCELQLVARDSLEDAYRAGLRAHRYVPVTQDIVFERLASMQPLDSEEFSSLQEAVVQEFRAGIEDLEKELSLLEPGEGTDAPSAQ